MEQVAVRRPGALLDGRNRNIVLLRVFDQRLTAVQIPHPPGGDNLDGRVEVVVGQLEADLIITLAGRSVGYGITPFHGGDFHLTLGDQRTGD